VRRIALESRRERHAGGSKPAALDEMADRRSVAADFCNKINHERKSKLFTTLSASVTGVVNSRRPQAESVYIEGRNISLIEAGFFKTALLLPD
jgi:hypothetical protein